MKRTIICLMIALAFSACRKDRTTPLNVAYQKIDRSVQPSDVKPLAVDLDGDGRVDYSFFVVRANMSNGDNLYAGVNPIGTHLAMMGEADDNKLNNMAKLVARNTGKMIDANLLPGQFWSGDNAYITIRNTNAQNVTFYQGEWGNLIQLFMPIQLKIADKTHLGWIRVSFNRSTETLTVIDAAYNKNAGEAIKAGQY